jgi:hypothetical protein
MKISDRLRAHHNLYTLANVYTRGAPSFWTMAADEIDRLTAQLAEREGIARELAEAIAEHIASYDVGAYLFDDALARFHAAEGDAARRAVGGEG